MEKPKEVRKRALPTPVRMSTWLVAMLEVQQVLETFEGIPLMGSRAKRGGLGQGRGIRFPNMENAKPRPVA